MSAPAGSPPAAILHGEGGDGFTVVAPITDAIEGGLQWESMPALADPAAHDQAIVSSVPAFCDYVNYGDVVRIGPPTNGAARPILEVLIPSGHRRVLAITSRHDPGALVDYLRELHPAQHALVIGVMEPSFVAVSVHPDLDVMEVDADIADWLDSQGARGEDGVSVSPVLESVVGLVTWPEGGIG